MPTHQLYLRAKVAALQLFNGLFVLVLCFFPCKKVLKNLMEVPANIPKYH